MSVNKSVKVLLLVSNLLLFACVYIVLPEGLENVTSKSGKGWTAVTTGLSQTPAGDLHIDLTIRNESGSWSTMSAVEGKPAILNANGKSTPCDTVFAGTGGHRLAPGFQMRGYMTGPQSEPKIQTLYVECKGVQSAPGARLAIDYVAFNGELDYYHQDNGKTTGTIYIDLDKVEPALTYPVYEEVEGLLEARTSQVPAISDNTITLVGVQRTEKGFQFTWQNTNPTEFALKTHIGNPPVIGSDGIIYGIFEIMDLASVPITPAGGAAEWTTEVAVPQPGDGFYILLSVESRQMRLYISHLIDISDL